jgi:hypothetical protein
MAQFDVVDLSDEPSPLKAVALIVAALNHMGHEVPTSRMKREADEYAEYLVSKDE